MSKQTKISKRPTTAAGRGKTAKTWIDYDALKQQLTLDAVLAHFDVNLRGTGDQKNGFCPLPTHQSKPGKKKSPSFSAHLGKGAWHCFGCGAKGNALELAVRLAGHNPDDPRQFREGALAVRDDFGLTADAGDDEAAERSTRRRRALGGRSTASKAKRAPTRRTAASTATSTTPSPVAEGDEPDEWVGERDEAEEMEDDGQDDGEAAGGVEALVNAPLDFELRHLDPKHPYLADRGFDAETVGHFGLGHCRKGLMRDRIAIPIRDEQGRLVAYGGRMVDDDEVDADTPKYRFPGPVEKERADGTVVRREFRKSEVLYHADDLWPRRSSLATLYVVEGFPACWWLWQLGFRDVVAVMGSSCSDRQAELLVGLVKARKPGEPTPHRSARLVLIPDGDRGGRQLAADLLPRVAAHCWCRTVELPEGTQPTDFDADGLRELW